MSVSVLLLFKVEVKLPDRQVREIFKSAKTRQEGPLLLKPLLHSATYHSLVVLFLNDSELSWSVEAYHSSRALVVCRQGQLSKALAGSQNRYLFQELERMYIAL